MQPDSRPPATFAIEKERTRFLGLSLDECIQAFFGGNAFVAVVILGLITLFLFREGLEFFGQNQRNLEIYRKGGLELVDHMRRQEEDHTALTRYLNDIRLRSLRDLTEVQKLSAAEAAARLEAFDAFSNRYADAVEPLRGIVAELTDVSSAIKERFTVNEDRRVERAQFLAAGMKAEAEAIQIEEIDFSAELRPHRDMIPAYKEAVQALSTELTAAVAALPAPVSGELQARHERFKELNATFLASIPGAVREVEAWDHTVPATFSESIRSFLFGPRWLTASFWQDWYGILPLFTGSLMVSVVALSLSVPFGVGAAIYVNQLASAREQRFIKPSIEFIAAFPSVVLGFFGIAVLGETLRALSRIESLSWLPGFPILERLNVLTAGCLLALLSVPTIFTLAEDAINNVPRSFKEASYALGANRLQTVFRIIIPAALSGIISAVLLGLGRVIGETMVVLLCAGNRIAIPDFAQGLGVFTQPVHTMTGIIAQEMGEVVKGSIHYRALFVVGICLFFIALLLNFLAQKIVARYRISIG